eukprot:TRINITY_DN5090_c0_g1_i1.p1 TRINITY_DN5090_c0_g1~~TRINITY_DN5090_c0_g1_i1.p1  ORF type:complete len:430 (+),score=111.45 TRINITY_DN5090_c0_g1_i1:50-1339(+)
MLKWKKNLNKIFNQSKRCVISNFPNKITKMRYQNIKMMDKMRYTYIPIIGTFIAFNLFTENKFNLFEKNQLVRMKEEDNDERIEIKSDDRSFKEMMEIFGQKDSNEEDLQSAIDYLNEEAKKGNPLALCILGKFYLQGKHTEKNVQKGLIYLDKASNLGNEDASLLLGRLYKRGAMGVSLDIEKSHKYFERCANSGNGMCNYWLGVIHFHDYYGKRNFKKSYQYFLKASEKGVAKAFYNLGVMYLNGMGVESDIEKSVNNFEKAASLKYNDAYFYLGRIFKEGVGVLKDRKKAIHYFEMASLADNESDKSVAFFNIATLYSEFPLENEDRNDDKRRAIHYYLKSAKYGSEDSLFNVAVLYLELNEERNAVEYFKLAASKGIPEAYFSLSVLHKNDPKQALAYMRQAANHGHEQAREIMEKNDLSDKKKK